MAIEYSPQSNCILRGISTQATYFTLQKPHFSKLLSPRAAIDFEDSNNTTRVLLGSSTAISYKLVEGKTQIIDQGPGLVFSGADKGAMMYLAGMSQGATISLYGQSQSPGNSREQAVLASSADGPSLKLSDAQGFQTIVGSTSLMTPSTGASSRTSAASVVLFDKDGKSIWSTP